MAPAPRESEHYARKKTYAVDMVEGHRKGLRDHYLNQQFGTRLPEKLRSRIEGDRTNAKRISTALSQVWAGITVRDIGDDTLALAIAMHDSTYSIDICVEHVQASAPNASEDLRELITNRLDEFRDGNLCKVMGAGLSTIVQQYCPGLASSLWFRSDTIPFGLQARIAEGHDSQNKEDAEYVIEEEADALARRCVTFFAPNGQPRIEIDYQGLVEVDIRRIIQIANTDDYRRATGDPTWDCTMQLVQTIKQRRTRIAFFSSTPKGGGVANMRHSLLRFLLPLGVDISWFVPKPDAEVFRITKNTQSLLQGTARSSVHVSADQIGRIKAWVRRNAHRHWLRQKGPLRPRSEGGADLIIVDDPQMPEVIAVAKEQDPTRPVIWRSHIELRDDILKKKGTAAEQVWSSIYPSVKQADVIITQPSETMTDDLPKDVIGFMPATTDWNDGLNKEMRNVSLDYHLHDFNQQCRHQGIPGIAYPWRPYIVQIARFDHAKGIADAIRAYAMMRRNLWTGPADEAPQLVLCGHASIDDPDGMEVLEEMLQLVKEQFQDLQSDIIIVRLGPSDQVLNALMSKARVALQLSTREGFEVKVSEALHKGIPVIGTRVGGLYLQIDDGRSGFLVDRHDVCSVARYLHTLLTDADTYNRMSQHACTHVSDEVGTVGNAMCWLYLAKELVPEGRARGTSSASQTSAARGASSRQISRSSIEQEEEEQPQESEPREEHRTANTNNRKQGWFDPGDQNPAAADGKEGSETTHHPDNARLNEQHVKPSAQTQEEQQQQPNGLLTPSESATAEQSGDDGERMQGIERTSASKSFQPNMRWICDMARESLGIPCAEGESRLPREGERGSEREG